jgi:hypothetical protein
MDLVRYAETLGHEFDYVIQNAWRYRDYLIRAFNEDVPYNQMILEHVAGDTLEKPRRLSDSGLNESAVATGFYWFTQQTHSPVDIRQYQADLIDNQIDVFTKTFLGLTVACARCHDHKFDPITTRDFYSLYGTLTSSRYQQIDLTHPDVWASVKKEREGWNQRFKKAQGKHWIRQAAVFKEQLLSAAQKVLDSTTNDESVVAQKQDANSEPGWADALVDVLINPAPTSGVDESSATVQNIPWINRDELALENWDAK